jgi:hypothetical protein
MTKNLKQWRQGDVFIEQVDESAEGRKRLDDGKGRVVLALGEVTGHSHRIESPRAALFLEQATTAVPVAVLLGLGGGLIPDRLLVLDGPATVVHEEHGSISLDAGTYRVRIQREYSPAELRNVAD